MSKGFVATLIGIGLTVLSGLSAVGALPRQIGVLFWQWPFSPVQFIAALLFDNPSSLPRGSPGVGIAAFVISMLATIVIWSLVAYAIIVVVERARRTAGRRANNGA